MAPCSSSSSSSRRFFPRVFRHDKQKQAVKCIQELSCIMPIANATPMVKDLDDDSERSYETFPISCTSSMDSSCDDLCSLALCSSSASSSATTTASTSSLPHHQVRFDNMVQVRHYEQVIGDHPFCRTGCPLALGWIFAAEEAAPVAPLLLRILDDDDGYCNDHMGGTQHQQRCRRLTDGERYERLVANGISEVEVRHALRRLYRERENNSTGINVKDFKAKAQFFHNAKWVEATV